MLSGEQRPMKKPDLDNVVKAVLDGCNAVAFRDDALVVELTARKLYAEAAGVDVVITRIAASAVATPLIANDVSHDEAFCEGR